MGNNRIEPAFANGTPEIVCADVGRWMHGTIRSGSFPTPPPALLAHIEGCAVCKGALAALVIEGMSLPLDALITGCDACMDDLPAYIELEMEDDVRAIQAYPHVWWHLLTCSDCAEVARLTRAAIDAERSGLIPPMPMPRPQPQPRPISHAIIPKSIRLNRRLLNTVFATSPLYGGVARSSKTSPIVLAEEENFHGHALSFLIEPQSQDLWQVIIRTAPPAPGAIRIRLGEMSFRAPFNIHGEAIVTDVPAHLLTQADGPDLEMDLALDEPI